MDENYKAQIASFRQELIEPAATLYAVQEVQGREVHELTKSAYGYLIDAHMLVTGVLGAALLRTNGKIFKHTSTSEECNSLMASFVIGMPLCEEAISKGAYIQACALLRQEMETVAQLKAVKSGKRKSIGSPNVKVLEKSIARLYGGLSNAAHVSSHETVRNLTYIDLSEVMELPGSTSGTRYYPVFDKELARRSFALHIMLTLNVIQELSIQISEQNDEVHFSERDVEAINLAVSLMNFEGLVEIET